MTIERVAVVGLGLVGGSIAGALRGRGSYVLGIDSAPGVVEIALEHRLIDRGAARVEDLLPDLEAVVLAVPVLTILDLLTAVDRLAPPEALLIDTGSVKSQVVERMERLPGAARAVGGHPLAGKAESGVESADPELFRRRPFLLVPSRKTDERAVETARELVHALHAVPQILDAEAHDRILARTSHLPQMVASVLASTLESEDCRVAGPGLRDMTRLAASDVHIWRDIFLANRQNVVEAAHLFIGELQNLTRMVGEGEADGIATVMERGRSASAALREALP